MSTRCFCFVPSCFCQRHSAISDCGCSNGCRGACRVPCYGYHQDSVDIRIRYGKTGSGNRRKHVCFIGLSPGRLLCHLRHRFFRDDHIDRENGECHETRFAEPIFHECNFTLCGDGSYFGTDIFRRCRNIFLNVHFTW